MKQLTEIVFLAKKKKTPVLVVAAAEDEPVLSAVKKATEEGMVVPILVGDEKRIHEIAHKISFKLEGIELIDEKEPGLAAKKAVSIIKQGNGNILMKGLVATSALLKAVLANDGGIKKSPLLSHLALIESPFYPKIFGVTDVAMNIYPTLEEKIHILRNSLNVLRIIGISSPKIAIITPVETLNEKIESTVHAKQLKDMNISGEITGCEIDGPLALDNAISLEAAKHKGIESNVAGNADLLLVPNLDAGNILYKSLMFLGGAQSAAIITGAQVPIVLTSRADSEKSKFLSIALAVSLTT